jgi:hypothetical protein
LITPRTVYHLLIAVAPGALAACGGGGGSGSSAMGAFGDADDAGLWQGTFSSTDGTERAFGMIVAPNGQFAGIIASSGVNGRLVIGTHDTTLNVFTATGTVFAQAGQALLPNGEASDPLSVSGGNVVAHSSLTGDYVGGGEQASFALKYDGLTSRGASLTAISGVYSVYPPSQGGAMMALTVNGNALTFATDGGCNGAGTIDVIDPALNMYSWSMLIGACGGAPDQDLTGLATLVDNPRGGFSNLLTLYGTTADGDLSFEYRGFK